MDLPTVTRAEWAERINARWQTSLTAIFETGRLIAAAKEGLNHGEFLAMVESDLPFGPRAAQMLMKVASDPRLTDAKHASHLPVSWATLHDLTKLDDATFEAKIADGTIKPDMERRDIAQTLKRERRDHREITLAAHIEALPEKRYGVILADPEWRFEPWSRATGMDRAADNHYPTSVTEVIAARPVEKIAARDCVLFLWATAPMLPHALAVMMAWGFDYRTHIIWRKAERYDAKPVLGTGYWFRNGHELLLVALRGDVPAPAPGTQWASLFDSRPRKHSQKPDEAYELIEEYFPNLPKIELNARDSRDGWDAWGNEISTAAQEPPSSPRRTAEQHWPAADVEASPVKRASEKVEAGARTAKLQPSSEGGQIPSADGSLAPRVISLEQILEHELEAAGPAMAPVDTATSPDIAGEDDRRKVVMAGDFQTQVAPTAADLEIPTFLRRGHPDCIIKAPG